VGCEEGGARYRNNFIADPVGGNEAYSQWQRGRAADGFAGCVGPFGQMARELAEHCVFVGSVWIVRGKNLVMRFPGLGNLLASSSF